MPPSHAIPHVADVHVIRGPDVALDSPYDVLIEVPHGALAADFDAYAAELQGPLPDGLVDFFWVNTDIGAFEVAEATAARLVAMRPGSSVAIVRSRVPRTFIDCNRRIDADAATFREGRVTPGLMPWVRTAADLTLLRERYDRYLAIVADTVAALCSGAAMIWMHTYAPRSVGVEVDMDIVTSLRRAYEPEVIDTWPVRPELDVISRDLDGNDHAPPGLLDALRDAVSGRGWAVGHSDTYPMHPSAPAWDHVMARPGRTLCLEVRRDLVADPWAPLAPTRIGSAKVDQVATLLADAIGTWALRGAVP